MTRFIQPCIGQGFCLRAAVVGLRGRACGGRGGRGRIHPLVLVLALAALGLAVGPGAAPPLSSQPAKRPASATTTAAPISVLVIRCLTAESIAASADAVYSRGRETRKDCHVAPRPAGGRLQQPRRFSRHPARSITSSTRPGLISLVSTPSPTRHDRSDPPSQAGSSGPRRWKAATRA